MRPIGGSNNERMFDRIVMDVVEPHLEVVFVADRVFPIAALPDATFAFLRSAIIR